MECAMKFAIISDIHDNLVNLRHCLDWCKKENIDQAICCGDITNAKTLAVLARGFKLIYLVRGNLEIYEESEVKKYENINYLGRFGCMNIDSKKVGLCHEKSFIENLIDKCRCDIIFYGHTHKPWIEKKDDVELVNPGTLGGVFSKATFAAWDTDTDKLELKLLETL